MEYPINALIEKRNLLTKIADQKITKIAPKNAFLEPVRIRAPNKKIVKKIQKNLNILLLWSNKTNLEDPTKAKRMAYAISFAFPISSPSLESSIPAPVGLPPDKRKRKTKNNPIEAKLIEIR